MGYSKQTQLMNKYGEFIPFENNRKLKQLDQINTNQLTAVKKFKAKGKKAKKLSFSPVLYKWIHFAGFSKELHHIYVT